jgi:hypothetical protein
MNHFEETDIRAREIWLLVEKKLNEEEKERFNRLLTRLIGSAVLDVQNRILKEFNSLEREAWNLYKYEAQKTNS